MDKNDDIIKMNTDIILKDRDGNVIKVVVPPPEYLPEIFGRR